MKKANASEGEGLIVLTNRTKEGSKIYSKLEDDDEDEDGGNSNEGHDKAHTHHVVRANIDSEQLDPDDSLDHNSFDPQRRLRLMTKKVSSR